MSCCFVIYIVFGVSEKHVGTPHMFNPPQSTTLSVNPTQATAPGGQYTIGYFLGKSTKIQQAGG